jgi:hypothetical protein
MIAATTAQGSHGGSMYWFSTPTINRAALSFIFSLSASRGEARASMSESRQRIAANDPIFLA